MSSMCNGNFWSTTTFVVQGVEVTRVASEQQHVSSKSVKYEESVDGHHRRVLVRDRRVRKGG